MGRQVFQFKITLLGSAPGIWRKIQISDTCTFWDLHVAIQDAMGWEDSFFHHFEVKNPDKLRSRPRLLIGFSMDEDNENLIPLAGTRYKLKDYITTNKTIHYLYDYDDMWVHKIKFEGAFPEIVGTKYPLCLEGKNACPPDGCGGIQLYNALLLTLKDKTHPDHKSNLALFGNEFAPNKFDVKKVKFKNASTRLKRVHEDIEMWLD